MKITLRSLAAAIMASVVSTLPVQATACELHHGLGMQNSFGEFHLPSAGDSATHIETVYGEPLRRLRSFDGSSIWDYGSFKVIVKNNRVMSAGLI